MCLKCFVWDLAESGSEWVQSLLCTDNAVLWEAMRGNQVGEMKRPVQDYMPQVQVFIKQKNKGKNKKL